MQSSPIVVLGEHVALNLLQYIRMSAESHDQEEMNNQRSHGFINNHFYLLIPVTLFKNRDERPTIQGDVFTCPLSTNQRVRGS